MLPHGSGVDETTVEPAVGLQLRAAAFASRVCVHAGIATALVLDVAGRGRGVLVLGGADLAIPYSGRQGVVGEVPSLPCGLVVGAAESPSDNR